MTTTRDRILRSAQTLLARSGLGGAGLNQLIASSGAPRGSLYHYFPNGKEQWVGEALAAYSEYFLDTSRRLLAEAPSLGAGIEAVLAMLAQQLAKTGHSGGCPVGAVILDLDADTPALRSACQHIVDAWQAELAGRFGSLPEARRHELAQFVLMTLEGALMLARLRQNGEPLAIAGRVLHDYLDQQLGR